MQKKKKKIKITAYLMILNAIVPNSRTKVVLVIGKRCSQALKGFSNGECI